MKQQIAMKAMANLSPEHASQYLKALEPESYTLGPGQTRFKGGEPIAQGEPKESKWQFKTEDKGDMYRKGWVNPETKEEKWGPWEKKAPTPSSQVPTNIFIGQDAQGNPLFVPSKGPPVVEPGKGPPGPILPKQQRLLPADEIKGLKTFDELANIASDIKKSYKPEFVGPVSGNVQRLKSLVFNNPEFVQFQSKIEKLMPVIYALSGKQINQWEMEWLRNYVIPNITRPSQNFLTILSEFENWTATKKEMLQKGYAESGYYVPQGQSQSQIPGVSNIRRE
jgi:hypothetical protein